MSMRGENCGRSSFARIRIQRKADYRQSVMTQLGHAYLYRQHGHWFACASNKVIQGYVVVRSISAKLGFLLDTSGGITSLYRGAYRNSALKLPNLNVCFSNRA